MLLRFRSFIRTLPISLLFVFLPITSHAEELQPEAFYEPFDTFSEKDWYVSDFAIKKPAFTTAWKTDQVTHTSDGRLELSLDPAPINTGKRFFGAEVQRRAYTHYGRYEAIMTPAGGHGVISAFFTYTGPFFEDPHDEIDFEFLGRDTNKVWVTRFADGERLPGKWIDLGFDTTDGPRLYAFEWSPERIVWYVEGKEIMRVEADDRTLPTTPGRVYFSIWGGGEEQADWAGTAPRATNETVSFDCISYVPTGETGRQCSDEIATN
jgi:beta-glucanase (GH16 family)